MLFARRTILQLRKMFASKRGNLYRSIASEEGREEDGVKFRNDIEKVMARVLGLSTVNLSTEIPREVEQYLEAALKITKRVKKIIGEKTHGFYFESSTKRYQHYFAAGMLLRKNSLILDIGNAPGHVGIGLSFLGMKVQGINLNDNWKDTYPAPEWLNTFNVFAHDIEKARLPFDDNAFDAVFFTEVLEHIAVANPTNIFKEIRRVLKPKGMLVFSTPNVCNISNIYALMNEVNVFWAPEIFYGSFDRHNREYTPKEVWAVMQAAGFSIIEMYGINCDSNWRTNTTEFIYDFISRVGDNHPLLRNTIMVLAHA